MKSLQDALLVRTTELHNHYYPQEHNSELPEAERRRIVTEWGDRVIDLYIDAGVSQEHVDELGRSLVLREGCADLVLLTESHEVPFCVCSA